MTFIPDREPDQLETLRGVAELAIRMGERLLAENADLKRQLQQRRQPRHAPMPAKRAVRR